MKKRHKTKKDSVVNQDTSVGHKIREMRRSQNMSLNELSGKTNLTPSSISQIERGLANPSMGALRRIANAMGTPVFYFFLDETVDESGIIVRSNERKILYSPKSNVKYELLSPNLNKKIEMVMLTLEAGQESSSDYYVHEGEEACVVLSGYITAVLGEAEYELSAGDSLQFNAVIPHKYINREKGGTSRLLFAITPPSF